MAWTEEKTEELKKLWAEGHTASQISKLLGNGISVEMQSLENLID